MLPQCNIIASRLILQNQNPELATIGKVYIGSKSKWFHEHCAAWASGGTVTFLSLSPISLQTTYVTSLIRRY